MALEARGCNWLLSRECEDVRRNRLAIADKVMQSMIALLEVTRRHALARQTLGPKLTIPNLLSEIHFQVNSHDKISKSRYLLQNLDLRQAISFVEILNLFERESSQLEICTSYVIT